MLSFQIGAATIREVIIILTFYYEKAPQTEEFLPVYAKVCTMRPHACSSVVIVVIEAEALGFTRWPL